MMYYQSDDAIYHEARREHAFLLRCEGLKFWEIGERLGVCVESSRQKVMQRSRELKKGMKRTKFYYIGGTEK